MCVCVCVCVCVCAGVDAGTFVCVHACDGERARADGERERTERVSGGATCATNQQMNINEYK